MSRGIPIHKAKNSKFIKFSFFVFLFIAAGNIYALANKQNTAVKRTTTDPLDEMRLARNGDWMKKMLERDRLEVEAEKLIRSGFLDKAIEKYTEAMSPLLLEQERDKSESLSGIVRIYQRQGKFSEALKLIDWFSAFPNRFYKIKKPQIDAQVMAVTMNTRQPIYDYIFWLEMHYQKKIPPNGYDAFLISDVICLYDYIGDYDAGIRFVDQILQYKGLGNRARADYVKVRQAFEQSKAEGIKSCFETQVPGEACVGHATQIVIQSDYIPW